VIKNGGKEDRKKGRKEGGREGGREGGCTWRRESVMARWHQGTCSERSRFKCRRRVKRA